MTGARTGMPLLAGIVGGLILAGVFLSPDGVDERPTFACPQPQEKEYVDVSEHWTVHLDDIASPPANHDPTPKVVRARFAATELGIRERLMVAVLAESSLSLALNSSLGRHVPKIELFADQARIDKEMEQLSNLRPYPLNDVRNGQRPHTHILGLMFNSIVMFDDKGKITIVMLIVNKLPASVFHPLCLLVASNMLYFQSVHELYDWFLLVKDATYVNPFELKKITDSMNWNEPVLLGLPTEDGRCDLDAGVLISSPAMKNLIYQRHMCAFVVAEGDSDQVAFEKCLHQATNLTCVNQHQGHFYRVWRMDGPNAAHDSIHKWRQDADFNSSLIVTKILSEADAVALHDHFVLVEIDRLDEEITAMEAEVTEVFKDTEEGPSWPAAVPQYSVPPNRYQVPTWEFFTMKDIFRSEPNQNVRPLEGNDLEDITDAVNSARQKVESGEPELEFVHMRNGYRLFDPRRGMDYMIDLVYKNNQEQQIERRVHLNRLIASTQLLNQVPYVKEDTDIIIVVPVNIETEVLPARRLLARHARLCTASVEESRKTRVVVAVSPAIDPKSSTSIFNDLEELKRRCKRSAMECDLVNYNVGVAYSPESTALDVAIDKYGPNAIFVILSPHADIQREYLDRTRINTIKKYQVFFPIPFVEYHPTVSGMDVIESEVPSDPQEAREKALNRLRDDHPPKRKRQLIVQKDHGRFDSLDFSCVSLYGSDYVALRNRLNGKRADLVSIFLGQDDIHVLRAVEPTLRLRYHQRTCDTDLNEEDYSRCVASKRENIAAKDQLAKLLFHEE